MLTKTVDEIHVRKCIAILVPNLVVHTRLGTKIYICLRTRKGQTILIQPIDTALFFMSIRRERPRLHQRLGSFLSLGIGLSCKGDGALATQRDCRQGALALRDRMRPCYANWPIPWHLHDSRHQEVGVCIVREKLMIRLAGGSRSRATAWRAAVSAVQLVA